MAREAVLAVGSPVLDLLLLDADRRGDYTGMLTLPSEDWAELAALDIQDAELCATKDPGEILVELAERLHGNQSATTILATVQATLA